MKLLKNNRYNEYELQHNRASYKTICELYAGDMVLCNEIQYIDDSIWDNMENGFDEEADEYAEIFQFYICNLSEYEHDKLLEAGFILSYSELLKCDIICVDHFGTSWNYILTDVELVDNYEELD